MKKYMLLMLMLCIQVSESKAQLREEIKVKKWRFSSIAVMASPLFQQRHANLSYKSLEKLVKDKKQLRYDMKEFKELHQFEMEGETVGVFFNFSKDVNQNFTQEWQVGINAYTYAEVYVDYERTQISNDEYIGWCLLQNRFDLDVAHFIKYNHKRFSVFVGASGSLGASFNDKVMLFDAEQDIEPSQVTAARSTRFVYGHLIFGLNINIYKRLAFAYELKRGIGAQIGENNRITSKSGMLGLQYSFNFKH